MNELAEKLNAVILESGCTYGVVLDTIGWLRERYRVKGENLLNSAKIQEVASQPDRHQPIK